MSQQTNSTPPTRQIRVFVVDDHPLVRESLTTLIARQPDLSVCGEAANSSSAFNALIRHGADVVVADLSLPGESGLELIKRIGALKPTPRVLVVSMHDESFYAERALRAGAKGYVMKHETTDRVVAAIRAIVRGETYLSGALAGHLARKFVAAGGANDISVAGLLTDRELQTFELLGRGYDTRRIAQQLHVSMKTVQAHSATIKTKLGLETMNELIREAVRWVERKA